mmetsp:Transcript_19789/g.37237  ORF Transcript_19789/g.37237 Transcript_19789/m.37237 type:complete len:166 (-) Transcript_19789:122-619(-)
MVLVSSLSSVFPPKTTLYWREGSKKGLDTQPSTIRPPPMPLSFSATVLSYSYVCSNVGPSRITSSAHPIAPKTRTTLARIDSLAAPLSSLLEVVHAHPPSKPNSKDLSNSLQQVLWVRSPTGKTTDQAKKGAGRVRTTPRRRQPGTDTFSKERVFYGIFGPLSWR